MIKQLQNIFSSFVHYSNLDHQNRKTDYHWFITSDNEIIGIEANELTNKDISILSAFMEPYNINFPLLSESEVKWKKRIHSNSTEKIDVSYRFVYFSIPDKQIDPLSFKEAINELFEKDVSVLWENEQEGIIIEEKRDMTEDTISYKQIIDVLMSDLYIKINFFVGPFQADLIDVYRHYQSIMEYGKMVFTFSDKHVLTYMDAVPYIFINQADKQVKKEVTKNILQEFVADQEFLTTIETFLECNLNISVTAKKLYMHRNSLQYRLDKFYEQTGIDIRDFHQALTVYLALLSKKDNPSLP